MTSAAMRETSFRLITCATLAVGLAGLGSAEADPAPAGHPRLYFTAADLPRLRALRESGRHAEIWKNIRTSADECLALTPRKAWIAPVSPDPIYENLYDRFYAIMGDLSVTEHLAFAYALSGEPRYGDAAKAWVLASCRAWKPEAGGAPDGGKAYAVTRLLKGLAVGYDAVYDRFDDAERKEIRETLTDIGKNYYVGYFTTPVIAGPDFHTHHAIVEWASFGVTALALLGEVPEAQTWLDATVKKFEEHLLPTGLAPDGAQVEGATFWASTMHYRLFFMDALRRVTGRDLFRPYEKFMNADLALASVAAERTGGYDYGHDSVVIEPPYGQLDYFAPVLVALAREYRRPIFQHLASWDRTLGGISQSRYVTPHGEQGRFAVGCYAFVWYDPAVPPEPDETRLSYRFPSVGEAYARVSWKPGDLLVGVQKGQIVVHAGARPVLIDFLPGKTAPAGLEATELADDGRVAVIRCGAAKTADEPGIHTIDIQRDRSSERRGGPENPAADESASKLELTLDRPARRLTVLRRVPGDWTWWCHEVPVRKANVLTWPGGVSLTVTAGEVSSVEPEGFAQILAVGFEKLVLKDPAPRKFPKVTLRPSAGGEIRVVVQGVEPR